MGMQCGAFWGFLEGHQRSQLSMSCPKQMTSKMSGQMAAKCCPDDHCYVGLFSRPNSHESIIRTEEIGKHCRLKVMLANIFIALNPHLLTLGSMQMLFWTLIFDCPGYDMVGPQSSGASGAREGQRELQPPVGSHFPPCWRKFWVFVGGNLAK